MVPSSTETGDSTMSVYTIKTSRNEDREGYQVWIYRDDGEYVSLAVAEDWGVFDDGSSVPDSIVSRAREVADRIHY
jgi:hypothetical protein